MIRSSHPRPLGPKCRSWAVRSTAVIASLLWPGVISRPAETRFHVALGDLPTWLLAMLAFGALLAAILAYRKQSSSDDHLAEQVKTQAEALADQRGATRALADLARLQGEALADQQRVNALQAKIIEGELRAVSRQQAEKVNIDHDKYAGQISGLPVAPLYQRVTVMNESSHPIREVACRRSSGQPVRVFRWDSRACRAEADTHDGRDDQIHSGWGDLDVHLQHRLCGRRRAVPDGQVHR